MRPKPGPKQRPETLQGIHVNLAKPIAVLVPGEFAGCMADRVMQVTPLRQPALDVIFIGVNHAPRTDRGSDDRVDGRLLDVLQHADDDLPSPLNHPQDRWLLLLQGPSAPLAFEASPPTESLFLWNRFGMSLMSGDDVDLVAFDRAGENDLGLVLDDALPQLRAHPLGVVGIEIQLAGDLLVGEIQPEEIQAQDPDPQGLMMASEDGLGQVVEPARTAAAEIALPSRLSFVMTLLKNLGGMAMEAADPLRPPQVADDLEAACVVDQGLNVEHPWSEPILIESMKRRRCENRNSIQLYR